MGSLRLLLAGTLAAGAALAVPCSTEAGPMFNVARLPDQQPGASRLLAPFDLESNGIPAPSEWSESCDLLGLAGGNDYFAVGAGGGTVFFLGGILVDGGGHLDLEWPLSLDELGVVSSAKPAGLALLGLGLLGAGLLNRRRPPHPGKPAS